MAEGGAPRQDAIAQAGIDLPRLRSASVALAPPAARFVLRGGDAAADAASGAFGIDLPRRIGRSASGGPRWALRLGPDEWLLVTEEGVSADSAGGLGRVLEAALARVPHSLVDVGHRQGALSITGRDAATALNAACPLDLSRAAFPVGMGTRTVFGKAEIVLWRTGEDAFRIEAWRSFLAYVAALLDVGCRDAASLAPSR